MKKRATITAQMVRELHEAGLTAEQIVEACECIEDRDLGRLVVSYQRQAVPSAVQGKALMVVAAECIKGERAVRPSGWLLDCSSSEWRSLRAEVFERDGYACVYCGEATDRLHADHVLPLSRGGRSTLDNLVTACPTCNVSKHAQTPEEWLRCQ